jgi:hypothetical protein
MDQPNPQKGKQLFDKKRNLRILLYQQEDKELQKEQNKILVRNTTITIWALVFAVLGALFQFIQNIIDLLK